MKPLIDCDILRYEIGACGEYYDEETGEKVIRSFEFVANLLDEKVEEICTLVWATEEPLCFLTVDARTKKIMNVPLKKKLAKAKTEEEKTVIEKEMEFKPNFRNSIATQKVYKGTRKKEKPYHYDNLTAYILGKYECVTAEGLEADDLLAIYQTNALREDPTPTTIICTRDKDLRMVEGMHFGWVCGLQGIFEPQRVDKNGHLDWKWKNDKLDSVKGTGMAFFCAQLITGDVTDNIPGIPRKGVVAAHEALSELTEYTDMLEAVVSMYQNAYKEEWRAAFDEQAALLWMVRELDSEGKPVPFKLEDHINVQS